VLDEDNWLKMEQIYLVIQLQLHTLPDSALGFGYKVEKDWNKLKSIFFRPSDIYQTGSTLEDMFNYHTEAKIEELTAYISKHNFTQNRVDVLSHLKLLHSMTLFLIKYQMKHSTTEIISSLKQKPFYQQMRVLDKSIKVLSDVLKVTYYKYGEMLQIKGNYIDLSHLLQENYLTGMSNIKKESDYEQKVGKYSSTNYEKDHGYIILPIYPSKGSDFKAIDDKSNKIHHPNQKLEYQTPWYQFHLDQNAIENKLDHYANKQLIDIPSEGKSEKILQVLKMKPIPSSQPTISSFLIKFSQDIVSICDKIQSFPSETPKEKTDSLKSILVDPFAVICPKGKNVPR
jgi:hypothetical protein